jgi:hypothetical protein
VNQKKAQAFLEDNQEVLTALADKVKNAELGSGSYEEFTAKKAARIIIEGWISDLFSIAYSVQDLIEDEENLYRVLDKRHREGRDDA